MEDSTPRVSEGLDLPDSWINSEDLKLEDTAEVGLLTKKKRIQHKAKTQTNRYLWTAISTYLLLLAGIYFCWDPVKSSCTMSSSSPPFQNVYTEEETSCGHDIDTAQARGCIFDSMGNNWVPKLCYNAKLASEAVHGETRMAKLFGLEELRFYLDRNMTQYVPTDRLGEALAAQVRAGGPFEAYVTEKWHIAHCLYMLRTGLEAVHRAAMGERDIWVHHTALNPHHAGHCTQVITDHMHREEGISDVSFGYTHCKRIA